MAAFVDALASVGCVEAACAHLGMAKSGLYEARRRNPLFALAWEDALIDGALPRLADELLSHAFKGSVERYYRDGEMVGEKHYTDTRLGLALLKRLDRMAAERAASDAAAATKAAQEARAEARRAAAAEFEYEQVDEVDDQPFSPTLDHPHPRILHTDKGWRTSFPPPARRAAEDDWVALGYDPDDPEQNEEDCLVDPLAVEELSEEDRWPGSPNYQRYCTVGERRQLEAWVKRQLAPAVAEHQRFFAVLDGHGSSDDSALLLGAVEDPGLSPPPSAPLLVPREGQTQAPPSAC